MANRKYTNKDDLTCLEIDTPTHSAKTLRNQELLPQQYVKLNYAHTKLYTQTCHLRA